MAIYSLTYYSFPYLEPVSCSKSSFNRYFLTCIQISQDAGQMVWYSISWRIFQFVVVHKVTGFDIFSKAEVDIFLELTCFFDDPTDVGNLISGSSAFSKPAWTSGYSWFMYWWSLAWRIWHYFISMWDECNCVVIWAFFGIAFLWDWNENWPFPVLWPLLSFPNLLTFWL